MKLEFLWQKTVHALKYLKGLRFGITHHALLEVTIVSLILFIAFLVRLLPMRWGWHLSEFDPYFHYRLTDYIVENGFTSWVTWHDSQRWYPYGQDYGKTAYPALALTAAFFYKILYYLAVPISLYNFCVLFPAIMGTLTCLMMYFLGKDIGGKEVGMFAALFLALSPSHIGRTSLGFFDDETIGIFSILLLIYLFLKAIETERPLGSKIKYAVGSGLTLGYLFAGWGAASYPAVVLPVFALILILMKKYSRSLLMAYSTVFGLALFIAVNVPRIGFHFLLNWVPLFAFGVFAILCLCELLSHVESTKWKMLIGSCFMASAVGVATLFFGYARPIEGKFLMTINPVERVALPIFQSVAEHRITAWGSFYYDFGVGAFFFIMGLYFAVSNPTSKNLLLTIYGLTALYFAGSMVRLLILLAPAFCLLWAIGLVRLTKPFITIMQEAPKVSRKKLLPHVGKEFSGAFLILVLLLLILTFVLPAGTQPYPRVYQQAYSPVTIMGSSVPIRADEPVLEWYEALMWMRENLPDDAIVCSWWDYGYWITVIGNKTTLADNGTTNMTQIQNIARMFLSNETEAIKILESYDTTHVVVFITFTSDGRPVGYGEEGKWRWMAKIAGLNETDYFKDQEWTEQGKETVIYKLMSYGIETNLVGYSTIQLEHFEKAHFSQGKNYGGIVPLVCIYKVSY